MRARSSLALTDLRESASLAIHAMLDAGLIGVEQIRHGVQVRRLEASSVILLISSVNAKYLYKKRKSGFQPGSNAEGSFHRIAQTESRFSSVRRLIPHLHLYDERSGSSIFECIADGRSIHYDIFHGDTSPAMLTSVGAALARCHSVHINSDEGDTSLASAPMPWVVRGIAIRHDVPAQNTRVKEFIEAVCASSFFLMTGNALSRSWRATHLIHGDVRLSNIICVRNTSSFLVDWELAGWGNPLFDLGCLMASLIFTIDLQTGKGSGSVASGESLFDHALGGYEETRGLPISPSEASAIYAFSSLRLIQHAIETLQVSAHQKSGLESDVIRIAKQLHSKSRAAVSNSEKL
jgi:Ser/Thr protein kinase RdoA (MazF antagonist)